MIHTLLQTYCHQNIIYNIEHIVESGNTDTCNSYSAANIPINCSHLKNYNVFVPSNKVYCTGFIFIEPAITQIVSNIISNKEIKQK